MTKLIALEEHFLTPAVSAAWRALPGPAPAERPDQALLEERLEEMGPVRLALMDESGIDVQVLSLTTPGLQNLPAGQGAALARQTNELLAATIARYPTRFQGLAVLPMADPGQIAPELDYSVRTLGLSGAMLYGRTGNKSLDHPDFEPLFAAAARLGVPLYIHPQAPPQPVVEAYYSGFGQAVDAAFASFGLGWHYEAGIQWVRLVLSGVFDRHPGLQLILGHWGEVALFYLERLEALTKLAGLQRSFADYARQNLYLTPSGMWSTAYLQRSLALVGAERLLFSADYPYQYKPGGQPRRFLEEAPLSERDRALLAHGNWERLTEERLTKERHPGQHSGAGGALS